MYSKYRCSRLCFLFIVLATLLYSFSIKNSQVKSRPKTILIKVDESIDPQFANIFNHPWQLLLKTRRCSTTCAFVSRDKLHDRPFTQNGFDHTWLDEKSYQRLLSKASASVSSSYINSGMNFVLKPIANTTYVHNMESFDASNPIPIEPLAPNDERLQYITIGLGHGKIPYNLVSKAFRDYFEFGELARRLALRPDFPGFTQRKFMIAFLPECNSLPPSHINYLVRLSKIVDLDLFGGCSELYKSNISLKTPSFIDRMNVAGLYKYILVVEPFNDQYYVSESFFESLVYYSMPIVIGSNDLSPYLPDDEAIVNAREFLDSPERLVQYVKSISEQEWMSRLGWKKNVNNRKPTFPQLWDWSLESIVCRICKMSDPKSSNDASEFLAHHGSIDNSKLLMYLDQRRWYKEKKKNRREKHARRFKNGILE